jgi:TonB-linked SusC/RagA family outer membrane protein
MYKKYAAKFGMPIGYACKILLIMRLTTVILLLSLMQVSASTLAQRVSLNVRKAALEDVLKAIRDQSGYDMVLDRKLMLKARPVDALLKSVTVKDALSAVLSEQPLTFTIEDKIIILAEKEATFIDKLINIFKDIDVHGRILDEKGLPIPGTTITATAGKLVRRTIANSNGEFHVRSVPEDAMLSISCLGYKTKTVAAKANLNAIVLEIENSELDEVQVQGYGVTSKRLSTGNISTIKADEISKQPISNPILALAGRMSGVYIKETNGNTGSNFEIVIQGQNTIQAGKLPLYIIDGIPFGGKPIENTVGVVSAAGELAGFSPLNSLSPNDIESISVLKDADATAIYGSRAANGVVLITTKKGVKGKTTIAANLYSGGTRIGRTVPMLNAEQYLNIRTQAFANDKITPTPLNAPDLTVFNTGGERDMQKLLAGNTGYFTNADMSVSGGEQNTQFLVSGSFRKESSVITNELSDVKVQGRFNIQHQSSNQRFKVNANVSVTRESNELPQFSLGSVYTLPPNLPVYNEDGSLAWETGYTNPLSEVKKISEYKNFGFLSNLGFNYEIIKGLNFKTDLQFSRVNVDVTSAITRASRDPSSASGATGNLTYRNSFNELYQIEPQLNYSRLIGKGKLEALIGGTYQYTHNVQPLFVTGTFVQDALYNDIGGLNISLKGSGESSGKYASFFGRINYNWDKKYIVTLSSRIDGSSKFAPGYRYGKFGSIGAAWIFSEEDLIKKELSWLSFGKLRSSYGSIGNDQIAGNGYITAYSSSAVAYGGVNGLYVARLANRANYSWELTKKFNLSLDLGFFKDKVLLTGSFYRNQTHILLMNNVAIASQSGFTGYIGNLAGTRVENKGVELDLNTVNLNTKGFSWRTSFNFTTFKNRLLSYPGLENTSYATSTMVVGKSLNMLSGYVFTGFENGLPTVKDINGDGKITAGLSENGKGDYVVVDTADPKFFGGITNVLTYKGFELDFLFQFVKKTAANIYRDLDPPGNGNNLPASILNYPFTYSSQYVSPASTAYLYSFRLSDAGFSDASYIRLKNVSLTYNLPENWLKPLKVNRASVYLRAQNLLTFTKYNGLDPETTGVGVPLLKMVTVGLQASF